MKSGTEAKLKFKQLQRRLNLAVWQARGLLDTLWNFAANNCPAGDIGRFTDEEIAIGIDWRDEPSILIDALASCRWIDRTASPSRLVIHDWPEHCEFEVHKSLARKAEAFADGTLPSLARIEKEDRPAILEKLRQKYGEQSLKEWKTSPDVSRRPQTSSGVQETPQRDAPTLPCLTVPNLTLPSQEQEPISSAKADGESGLSPASEPKASDDTPPAVPKRTRHAYSTAFEEWYAAYPRHEAKHAASAAYGRRLQTIALNRGTSRDEAHVWLVEVTRQFAASPAGRAGQFTPHPATWLNEGRYDDDQTEWSKNGSDTNGSKRTHAVGPGQRWDGT